MDPLTVTHSGRIPLLPSGGPASFFEEEHGHPRSDEDPDEADESNSQNFLETGRTHGRIVPLSLAETSIRYLPESWTENREWCRAAGVPDEVGFLTKRRMALVSVQRLVDANVPFGWLTADEAYGNSKYLRVWPEEHRIAHVVAVRSNDGVPLRPMPGA